MPKVQMSPKEFRDWRKGRGLTMTEAAKVLSEELDRTYRYNRIHEWESGKVAVPALVAFFILQERMKGASGGGESASDKGSKP
jgi:hypothetical protein